MGQQALTPLLGHGRWDCEGQTREPIEGYLLRVPLEVLYIILDMLDVPSLKIASLLNKHVHQFVMPRLWKKVLISIPNPIEKAGALARRRLDTACHSITGNPRRALHIQHLSLQFDSLGTLDWKVRPLIRQLSLALATTSNLKTLEISPGRHWQMLTEMLCNPPAGSLWPFRLRSFAYNPQSTSIYCRQAEHDRALLTFLIRQIDLRELKIQRPWSWIALDPRCLPMLMLPQLVRYEGPSLYARRIITSQVMESMRIKCCDVSLTELEKNYALQPLSERPALIQPYPDTTLVHHVSLDLDYRPHHDTIPFLLGFLSRISLPSIISLRLLARGAPSSKDFPSVLEFFPSLKSLEWTTVGPNTDHQERSSESVGHFVLKCADLCPTLEEIKFSQASADDVRVWRRVESLTLRDDKGQTLMQHIAMKQSDLHGTRKKGLNQWDWALQVECALDNFSVPV
ncbi:hypothetical protein DL93DRAFT_2099659 [Clavulina sp. PMI_390]|nr:hypothetical protein DL93DRAFT_2099659 [Clavulina sp. PMI_390]